MKTIQMTFDEALLVDVDEAARRLETSRSAFAREALHRAVRELRMRDLGERHRRGYASAPVADGEFSVWEDERQWGEPSDTGRSAGTGSALLTSAGRWSS